MNYELINQYGIPVLVIIFIVMSLYYRNVINILIFLVCFFAIRNFMEDNSALIVAYILVLSYGIVKNFHLLENFRALVLPSKSNTNANANANANATANANANANSNANDNGNGTVNANDTAHVEFRQEGGSPQVDSDSGNPGLSTPQLDTFFSGYLLG